MKIKNILTTLLAFGLVSGLSLNAQDKFKPTLEKVEVNGVGLYLLPEDGEANEDGLVDQFWFTEKLANKQVPKNITLVDVRKAERYKAEHIENALSVPFDSESETLDISKLPKDGIIVFYCNTGLKSTDARGSLEDDLAQRVFILDATYKCDKKSYKNCTLTPNEAI